MTPPPLRPGSAAPESSDFPPNLEAPQEHQRFLSTLLGNLPGLVYCSVNEPEWPITYISPGCEKLTGWSPADFVERRIDFGRLIVEEDRDSVWDSVQQALARRQPFQIRYRLRTKSGEERWIWEKGCGIFGEGGELLRLEGFLFDVSQEKRLEEQLLHAQKMEAVGRMAGGVAHDFNNLLTAILGYGDMLTAELSERSVEGRHARQIVHAAQRAADLTRRLLAFARKEDADPRVFDVNRQLLALDPLLRRLVGEDLEFVLVPGENAGTVRADPGQIEQVLVNLAVNARQAMPAGGKLVVSTEAVRLARPPGTVAGEGAPGDWVLITVDDTGVGMRSGEMEHAFEPFFTTKPDGTGLGLSTCLGIVQQAGGHMEVDSSPARGTRFRVYLPRAGAVAPPPLQRPTPAARGGSERLLLVEDEALVRAVAISGLQGLGYQVHSARSGVEALEAFAACDGAIDLLVTDLVMPQMSGTELARKLRTQSPDLPVLFVSGYAGGKLDGIEQEPGSNHFLPKPFSHARLAGAVREILDRSSQRRP